APPEVAESCRRIARSLSDSRQRCIHANITFGKESHLMPTVATRAELESLLADDVPYGDLTTEALGIGATAGTMEFAARDSMVLALAEDAAAMIELCSCRAELSASSGTVLGPGMPILRAHGSASGLRSWKVAQTLIEIWSGVAT